MKAKLLLLSCLLASITCYAQYPAPLNFKMSYKYILLGENEVCCGKIVTGPVYCTDFQWEAPDLSATEAKLNGYNIYFYHTDNYYEGMNIPDSEINLIAHTTDTCLQMEIGIIGVVWVTAFYSDPESESQPSNFEVNGSLPLSNKELEKPDFSVIYNKHTDCVEIFGRENITSVRIFRMDGTIIKSVSSSELHYVNTKGVEKGIYVINILTKDGGNITEKIKIH